MNNTALVDLLSVHSDLNSLLRKATGWKPNRKSIVVTVTQLVNSSISRKLISDYNIIVQ